MQFAKFGHQCLPKLSISFEFKRRNGEVMDSSVTILDSIQVTLTLTLTLNMRTAATQLLMLMTHLMMKEFLWEAYSSSGEYLRPAVSG